MMRPAARFVAFLAGITVATLSLPARAQDISEVVVRLSQVEAQMRQMSGKIEELQYQNQQLRDELKRFREDAEFRFQDTGKGGGPRGSATPVAPPRPVASSAPPAPVTPRPVSRGDVYDPDADPGAPGAPRQLGSPDNAAPPPRRSAMVPGSIMDDGEPRSPVGAPVDIVGGSPAAPRPGQTSIAATGTDSARADFDNAYTFIQQRQFEQAEMGFRSFLQSHPRSKLTPDATYWLGESYLQRARYRDAAEQFLKMTTSFGTSPKGADGMFKLGVSLRGLGANDQACATFAEFGRKYPNARPALVKDVQREQQRAKCAS